MDDLILDLDFSGVTKPSMGGGISYPPRDYYIGTVKEYKTFEDEGKGKRLYAYIQTEKGIISDNFRIGQEIDMQRLAGHLIAVGVDPRKVLGAKGAVPFHKFVGKKLHIFYTPPLLQPNGQRIEGSYPKTKYYTAEEWKAAKEAGKVEEEEQENKEKVEPIKEQTKTVAKDVVKEAAPNAAPDPAGTDDWLS